MIVFSAIDSKMLPGFIALDLSNPLQIANVPLNLNDECGIFNGRVIGEIWLILLR